MKKQFMLLLVLLLLESHLFCQLKVSPADLSKHIGERVTMSGTICGGHFYDAISDQPTLLFLCDTLPGAPVVIQIPVSAGINFQADPIQYFSNRNVTVKGVIKAVDNTPQIVITDSTQLSIDLVEGSSMTTDNSANSAKDVVSSFNLDTYNNCPNIGQGTSQRLQELNKLKNRYSVPLNKDINPNITVDAILKPGNDTARWSTGEAVQLIGYVFDVKPGGDETCNCHSNDKSQMDTHIVLVADPAKNNGSLRIIVEITPRMRFLMMQKGIDWSTDTIKSTFMNQWVKVTGWLFFDDEHKSSAENTHPGNASNWRATSWEVHPITSIELVQHK